MANMGDFADPTDQFVNSLPQANTSPQVGFGAAMLGGLLGHLTGTISPLQARALGVPQAAGMTLPQLQLLLQQPERQAQLADIQSQTRQRNAMADFTNRRPGSTSQSFDAVKPGTDEWKGLLDKVYSGTYLLDDIFRGMSQGPARARFLADMDKQHPDWAGPTQAISQRTSQVSGARSQAAAQGKQKQNVGSAVSAMEGTLDKLKPLITSTPDLTVRKATEALRRGETQIQDDPQATQILGYLTSLRGFYATMLHGGGVADVKNEQDATKAIADGIGKRGFPGLEKFLRTEGQIRMRGVEKPATSKKQGSTQNANAWNGSDTHIYPDGTIAKWNGTSWVRGN